MKVIIFCIAFTFFCQCISGQAGLQSDILLHPADAFTAYTLEKNEFVYNQSPFTFPFPSWAWWGITDRLTAEIDLLPLLGGLFVEPNLPVPSFNLRYKLKGGMTCKTTVALEAMYQHLWVTQNQLMQDDLLVERTGNSFYLHVNSSIKLSERLQAHLSAGFTYTENLLFQNSEERVFFSKTYNPDLSLSLDYRYKPWTSLHLTTSYGTTFVYLDNIPRKYQVSYGFRLAPFWKNKYSFLRTFRAEFIGFYMYFPDVNGQVESVLPIFPYFYWQFKI